MKILKIFINLFKQKIIKIKSTINETKVFRIKMSINIKKEIKNYLINQWIEIMFITNSNKNLIQICLNIRYLINKQINKCSKLKHLNYKIKY